MTLGKAQEAAGKERKNAAVDESFTPSPIKRGRAGARGWVQADAAKMPPEAWYEMHVKPWHPESAVVGARVLSRKPFPRPRASEAGARNSRTPAGRPALTKIPAAEAEP